MAIFSDNPRYPELKKLADDLQKEVRMAHKPEIKKTDIEIVRFRGEDWYEGRGLQASSIYILTYNSELNIYKLYQIHTQHGGQYGGDRTSIDILFLVQTIPMPLEYVKDNFREFFNGYTFKISGSGVIPPIVNRQIRTIFDLMCDHFIDVEECKKTIAKHKSKGANWGSRVSLKSRLNGESAQNKRLLEKIKKQEVDIARLKSGMSELEQVVIEKDKALQKKQNIKDEIQIIMLEGFESLQQKLSDKLRELTHKL